MIWALKMASWFLCQTMQGTSRANIAMDSRFWLAAYLVWLFDSHFSLVHFSRLKYILARQILHFSPLLLTMPDKVWPLKGGSVIQFFFFWFTVYYFSCYCRFVSRMMTYSKMMMLIILQFCFVTVTHAITVTGLQQKPGMKYTALLLLAPVSKLPKMSFNPFFYRHMLNISGS